MQKEQDRNMSSSVLGRAVAFLKRNPKTELLIYGVIVFTVLGVYFAGLLSQKDAETAEKTVTVSSNLDREIDVENRLKSVLSCIRGAGRVEVMITYASSGEIVTAMSTSRNSNTATSQDGSRASEELQEILTEEPATVEDGSGVSPIVLMEKQPVIRGVIVVAEGAADIAVRLDLERAVHAVLDVPVNNVEVFELGNQG
ncbi:MAG: hypothetical protein IJF41_06835 [Clostridia bacterium]|nr:hypothetical protein [Clostridia bacterium]